MQSTVALVRCEDYDEHRVFDAVGEGLSLLGGIARFVKAGEKVLLKPNLLSGKAPEKVVCTHPSVLKAVAQHSRQAGAQPAYGDSPGFGRPEAVARKAGLVAVAEELDMPLADFINGQQVSFPEGKLLKQFTIAQGVLDADALISLSKLKTHALTRMTGAIKNQFGCIPGLLKGELHARMSEMDRFAQMLVDLCRYVDARIYIMDAVIAMEGNGPGNGKPKPMAALLFSDDPVALDATACRMMKLDPAAVPTNRWGQEMGLGTFEDVQVVGEPLESLIVPDFKPSKTKPVPPDALNSAVARAMRHFLVPKPVLDPAKCTRCGTCVKVCPAKPKAIDFRDKDAPPSYDYAACIRCYCCQELCPEGAIDVHTPVLGRFIRR